MRPRPSRLVLASFILLAACGSTDPGATTGTINVTTTTVGATQTSVLDTDGYDVTLDGGSTKSVASNGATFYSPVPISSHIVALVGTTILSTCAVTSAQGNPVTLDLTGQYPHQAASFTITCT